MGERDTNGVVGYVIAGYPGHPDGLIWLNGNGYSRSIRQYDKLFRDGCHGLECALRRYAHYRNGRAGGRGPSGRHHAAVVLEEPEVALGIHGEARGFVAVFGKRIQRDITVGRDVEDLQFQCVGGSCRILFDQLWIGGRDKPDAAIWRWHEAPIEPEF